MNSCYLLALPAFISSPQTRGLIASARCSCEPVRDVPTLALRYTVTDVITSTSLFMALQTGPCVKLAKAPSITARSLFSGQLGLCKSLKATVSSRLTHFYYYVSPRDSKPATVVLFSQQSIASGRTLTVASCEPASGILLPNATGDFVPTLFGFLSNLKVQQQRETVVENNRLQLQITEFMDISGSRGNRGGVSLLSSFVRQCWMSLLPYFLLLFSPSLSLSRQLHGSTLPPHPHAPPFRFRSTSSAKHSHCAALKVLYA